MTESTEGLYGEAPTTITARYTIAALQVTPARDRLQLLTAILVGLGLPAIEPAAAQRMIHEVIDAMRAARAGIVGTGIGTSAPGNR
jgi:hypothetical protein